MESRILNETKHLIAHINCCNSCLGRQFGNILSGLSNYQRGIALKILILMEWEYSHRLSSMDPPDLLSLFSKDFEIGHLSLKRFFPEIVPKTVSCDICQGILDLENLKKLIKETLQILHKYEFSTFLVGSKFPPMIIDNEDIIRSNYNLEFGESIKSEFNREIGKLLRQNLGNAEVEFKAPDIVVLFDLMNHEVKIKSNPLFIIGKYRKLQRGIPQSKWFCRKCKGKGCENCNFTGKMYQESVEEFISKPILQAAEGVASKFHGSGREDIDARMLGKGRPFILEISEPQKRNLILEDLRQKINEDAQGKVEIEIEGISNRTKVRELKTQSSRNAKAYRAVISLEKPLVLSETELNEIADKFSNTIIKQRTPLRVAHRRADKIRTRLVTSFQIEKIDQSQLSIYIICEGGLYVKELISGDEGRTQPNLTDLLNTGAKVTHLDVLEVFSSKDIVKNGKK